VTQIAFFIFNTLGYVGEFENSVFTSNVFFRQRYAGQKKIENATITGQFGLVFAVNPGGEFA